MKFEVKNRFSGKVQFEAEIECAEDASVSVKLGLAVKWALKARADLAGADLAGADLAGAYLAGAYLAGADLAGAYLADAKGTAKKLPHFQLPAGDLIGWKKCGDRIVKMLIPADAKRTASLVGRKCRAEFVKVLEIDGADEAVSGHDCATVYRVGETVRPDSYDDNPLVECTHGIHWFATRAEAEEY